ncbi:alcohol dehydrogenase catalytic domain-containing protein [Galbitalea sp. SE-J8]|uniref:alcohol dehydrogenase catalytic domain-containing protein n=1 Tax=Galbitalea sp. SE-J8 TaxID=3054952 RepID=UPI00259D184C|nr:alcohol dehydrogenase catalytic domain-containing protein [Galbitalea sp. SE-J8]MDM4761555.1 alcohol dehydrogenase catalytic domain-containing protein [Galbitalea sp. SE-J8]
MAEEPHANGGARSRRLVTIGPGDVRLEVEATERRTLAADDVRLRVLRVGICGSDAHILDGTHPYLGYPVVQGHEIVARVEAVGHNSSALHPGDVVVVEPALACGECPTCRRGSTNCCPDLQVVGVHRDGGLADALIVPRRATHPVAEVPIDAAVFVEPIAVALWALRRGRMRKGDRVLVLGAGSLGRSVVLAAAAAGAAVTVADRSPARRHLAAALGADSSLSPHDLRGVAGTRGAPDLVIDTTGSSELISIAAEVVRPAGLIVVVGISEDALDVPVADFSRRELAVVGARNSVGMFPAAIDLVRSHAAALVNTIQLRVPLEGASDALLAVAGRTIHGRALVVVSDI